MNRLIRYESSGILFTVCFVAVSAFGLISFNNPYIFDVTFSLFLVLLSLLYKDNRDVLSLAVILVVAKIIGYWTVWLYDHFASFMAFKLAVYLACLACCLLFRYQTLAKLIALNILIGVLAEVYWFTTDYAAPEIHFYYVIAVQAMIIRYFLMMRPAIFRCWHDVKPQKFDGSLSELFFASATYSLIMSTEYLVRHVLNINLLFFYSINEYVQHMIGLILLLIILFYTISHPKYLRV